MKIYKAIIAISAVLAVSTSIVNARSQSAIIGNPHNMADSRCFQFQSDGKRGLTQVCPGTRSWAIPIVYDNHGAKTITVTADSGGSGRVSCQAHSVDMNGNGHIKGTPQTTTSRFSRRLPVHLPHAHGYGSAWVTCRMPKGSRISSVHY